MSQEDEKGFAIDFAVILHSYSAQLSNVIEWLEPTVGLLRSPFTTDTEPTPTDLETALQKPIQHLIEEMQDYLERLKDFEGINVDSERIHVLKQTARILQDYIRTRKGKRVRAPYLFQQIEGLIQVCSTEDATQDEVNCNRILSEVREIQRTICMYDLSVAMFTLREMKGQANALHGFYAYDISTKEPVRVVTMFELLQSVIQENAPYAASRQIELRPSGVMNLKVVVCKRDMIRALSQLVRNAVKYNYMLDNHPVWVDIRCYHSKNGVGIDIENWGYPITADEIRRGSIYQVGKRGTFAARSKQSGFGIGLADARRVITEHGGSISIRSVPARKGGDPNNYNQPFITTVTVELPDANS